MEAKQYHHHLCGPEKEVGKILPTILHGCLGFGAVHDDRKEEFGSSFVVTFQAICIMIYKHENSPVATYCLEGVLTFE